MSNLDFSISVAAESWQPADPLPDGPNDFEVFYADTGESFVTPLNVISGSITWGNSLFAPFDYPAQTPLLALGSMSLVQFSVPEPASGSLALAALLTLGGLARRQTHPQAKRAATGEQSSPASSSVP